MSDPVLDRIRKTRREIAREFNYDLKKYARYIEERHNRYVEERRKAGKPVEVIDRGKVDRVKLRRALEELSAKPPAKMMAQKGGKGA